MVPSHQRSSAYEDDLSSSLSGTELKQFPCSFGMFCTSCARYTLSKRHMDPINILTHCSLEGIINGRLHPLLIPILDNERSPSLKSCASAKSEVGR